MQRAQVRTRLLALVLSAVASVPTALAQTASHPVAVSVPSYLGIRIVGADGGTSRSVVFDYGNDAPAYVTALDGGGTLVPTNVTRFTDVEVNVVGFGRWSVYVEATPFVYAGPGDGAGLELADIRMDRGSASGLIQDAITIFWILGSYDTTWTLAENPQRIARSLLGTGGWRSLGFNGWDYSLAVDGDEDAGTYTTTVTYYLTFP